METSEYSRVLVLWKRFPSRPGMGGAVPGEGKDDIYIRVATKEAATAAEGRKQPQFGVPSLNTEVGESEPLPSRSRTVSDAPLLWPSLFRLSLL